MVWGFTCLCARSDPLMSVVAAEVVKKIKGFKHQERLSCMCHQGCRSWIACFAELVCCCGWISGCVKSRITHQKNNWCSTYIHIYNFGMFPHFFGIFWWGGRPTKLKWHMFFFRFAAVKLMRQLMCPFQELANTAWAFAKLLGFTKFEVCYAV